MKGVASSQKEVKNGWVEKATLGRLFIVREGNGKIERVEGNEAGCREVLTFCIASIMGVARLALVGHPIPAHPVVQDSLRALN